MDSLFCNYWKDVFQDVHKKKRGIQSLISQGKSFVVVIVIQGKKLYKGSFIESISKLMKYSDICLEMFFLFYVFI